MSGTNYPGGLDDFTTPSDPEDTPLSSAGDGTRNLVESIKDLGLATVALEGNAAIKTHDHSGGADGTLLLSQAHTHTSPDTDTDDGSLHHTLGTDPFQAAKGNHGHLYADLPDRPFIPCLSTTRPDSPTLGMFIWEIDTNRMRVWAQFTLNNIAAVGVVTTDAFQRTSTTDLGADWEPHYFPNPAPDGFDDNEFGVYAIPDGSNARWVYDYPSDFHWPPSGWPWPYTMGRVLERRINNVDKHSLTDDQSITWQAGPTVIPFNTSWPPTPSSNDMYFRLDDATTEWIRVSYSYKPGVLFVLWLIIIIIVLPLTSASEAIMVYYTTNGIANETHLQTLSIASFDPFSTYQADLQGYELTFYSNSRYQGQVVDASQVTAKGSSNRGWGFGATVGRSPAWATTLAAHPTDVNQIWFRDIVYYTSSPIWQLIGMGSKPLVRLLQTTIQQLNHAGSLIQWNQVDEDTFGFVNLGVSQTDIVIKEPGVYDIDAAIQWDDQRLPDVANIVMLLNGVPTEIQQHAYLRGNTFSPGFSQTLHVTGKKRFAVNDVIQFFVSYTSGSNLWTLIYSYADAASKIFSRMQLSYDCP